MRQPASSVLAELASAGGGYVSVKDAAAAGVTESQLRAAVRGGEWTPVRRGLRRARHEPDDAWRDRVRQALLGAGDRAVAAGHTAARLHGIVGAPASGPIWIAVPRDRHPVSRPGIRLLRTVVAEHELTMPHAVPTTAPRRTVLDCCRHGDALSAVCITESAFRQELVSESALRAVVASLGRQSGARRAAIAIARADVRSESPLETQARLLLVDAGLPAPELQFPIATGDARRVDLAYRAPSGSAYAGLAIEIDGRDVHAKAAAFDHDPRRQTALEEADWLVRRFTARHLEDAEYVVTTVRRALDRIGIRHG